ncbi:hypothetical protein [Megasphaera stantonii]|uniref:hypothetical protein n=1 Tax=Megasphaera stantonii TaxID=2144175 RepID=UPI001D3F6FD6|nr:hypothetical protein [Megasphaera stantonii]HJE82660.1 hypothetical protein [Megasphaera stantonii]
MSENRKYEVNSIPKYGAHEAGKLLLLRIFIVALSLYVLWVNAENSKAFFSTLFTFSLSQLLYALSLRAQDAIRQVVEFVALFFIGVLVFASTIGLFGGLVIVPTEVGYVISLVKSTQQIYLFRSESLVYVSGIILLFVYVIEWCTSWFSVAKWVTAENNSRESNTKGRD